MTDEQIIELHCPECDSTHLVRSEIVFTGRRQGRPRKVQQYKCKDCGLRTTKPIKEIKNNDNRESTGE